MPTYDYECGHCDQKFEQYQSITAAPLKKCPNCGRNTLRRLIGTGAGVLFKGSGFYQTDYRSDSYKQGAEAETKSTSTSDSDTSKAASADSKSGSTAKPSEPKADKPKDKPRRKAGGKDTAAA